MKRNLARLLLAGCVLVQPLQAQIKHVEMHVEGRT